MNRLALVLAFGLIFAGLISVLMVVIRQEARRHRLEETARQSRERWMAEQLRSERIRRWR
jgi:hypothetical protein